MPVPKPPSVPLAALLAAASALETQSLRAQDDAATGDRVSYRYTEYDEDSLASPPLDGSDQRYRVRAQQFRISTKVSGRTGFVLGATQEVMSGSSPWFVVPGNEGRPQQVMSGATIRDTRREVTASLVRDPESSTHTSVSASYSQEDDYRAASLGAERSTVLLPALTLGYGISISHDTIQPTDAALYDRVQHESKNTVSAFGSLAWVLDRQSVLQIGLQLTQHDGYLSDPYKRVYVDGDILRDMRPNARSQAALLLRYRHGLSAKAALHADYRFAFDSWGLRSYTVELAWYQSLGNGWRIVPGLRYYSQRAARFYAPFVLAGDPRYASSDFRLSSYGAAAIDLNLRKRFGHWELSLGANRYRSESSLDFNGGGRAPGLVSFTRVYAGLDYGFD